MKRWLDMLSHVENLQENLRHRIGTQKGAGISVKKVESRLISFAVFPTRYCNVQYCAESQSVPDTDVLYGTQALDRFGNLWMEK